MIRVRRPWTALLLLTAMYLLLQRDAWAASSSDVEVTVQVRQQLQLVVEGAPTIIVEPKVPKETADDVTLVIVRSNYPNWVLTARVAADAQGFLRAQGSSLAADVRIDGEAYSGNYKGLDAAFDSVLHTALNQRGEHRLFMKYRVVASNVLDVASYPVTILFTVTAH